uniref:Zona pellucida sperm-binding protein 3 n=1 Tax=Sinocyclocheilus rhinocerous TaxID=307959 RepID=A0A673KYY8_9TELE
MALKMSYSLCFSTCCAWFLVTFRKHNVSSNALHPTWIPYVAAKAGEEQLHFSLKLMTDDWRYERPSNAYFLGDFINLEASVVRANHVPLRVFVESCAATLGPSGEAATMYTFIENSGCLMDAKLTNSRSRFMSRIQDDKLQFQIEAFRFKQDSLGMIYVTCHLKATTTSSPTDMMNKACSFVKETNSWTAVNGDDQVCGCCETSCTMRKGRSLDTDGINVSFFFLDSTLEDEATIGPIFVHERLSVEDEPLLQINKSSQVSSKDAGDHVDVFQKNLNLTDPKLLNGSVCCLLNALFFLKNIKMALQYNSLNQLILTFGILHTVEIHCSRNFLFF